MALKIRLTRLGDKKSPFYRMIVAEQRSPRDGKCVAELGTVDPLKEETLVNINHDECKKWLACGAIPTPTAKALLVKCGCIEATPYKPKANAKPATPRPKKKDAKKS